MGAMNKLRQNTGVILWILVLSFGIIWTLQDSNVFEAMNRPTQNVATVNGQSIGNEEYNNAVDQQRRQFQQQNEDVELTPRMEEVMRQRAYDQVVEGALLEQEMERLGITVTDAEVEEMVFGENPHPIIRQQFADSTGQINYQLLENMAQNPEAKPQWLQLEQILREQRRQQKMSSLVRSSILVSEKDVEDYHWRQNASASVEYVALRYASVSNDSISVSESDLRSYYEDNKEDFERKKTLSLDYVTLPKVPTAEDTSIVFSDLERNRDQFETTDDDSLFLAQNSSERSFSREYQTPDELETAIADSVFTDPTPGRVVGPLAAENLAHLIKIRDARPSDEEYVHASHILLEADEDDAAAREQLQSIRDSIESGAARFEEMASRYSDDQSAAEGGDLGWFGRGTMADQFEDAAFNASPGEIVGPIQTEFGHHLIQVSHRTSQAVQLADLAYSLEPGQGTLSDKQNTLEDIAFYAEENSSFTEEAESRDLEVKQVQAEADQESIPDLGDSRALSSFMQDAETGDISEVIDLDDKFALLRVTDIQPEGYRPFEEVKSQIRPRVELQKKKEIQARRAQRALDDSGFDQLPQALGTQLRSQSNVTFSTEEVPGLGRDPTFAGTVFGLDEGETSGVVEGENAAFVVRVTSMQTPGELTDAERQQIRQQLLRQRQQEVSSKWLSALKEDATIEDQRQQFQ